MAREQTHGRGQRGSIWLAPPHQNLTCSIYLKPRNLSVSKQFYLTTVGSLAIRDALSHYTTHSISIKWPNDIYIDNRKICGLLLENRISGNHVAHSILGIGLNVLQTDFPREFQQKAISLKQISQQNELSFIAITQHIQRYLTYYMRLLTSGHSDRLIAQYNAVLFQKNELKSYKVGDQIIQAKIRGVEEDGLLQIQQEKEVTKHDLKDIRYIP